MTTVLAINKMIGDVVWGPPMLILLLGTGILLSCLTGFIVIRKFVYIMRNTLMKMFKKSGHGEGEVSVFQAVSTALAATVGTGNIAGVALAIAIGGPGAVFWMWLSAIFGMTTKFSEAILAITYRKKNQDGSFSGGPMYYIARGLGYRWLAGLFATFAMIASFGIGCMTQSNSIADALKSSFNVNPIIVGVVLAVLSGIVILGGIQRIGQVTEKLVPFMALFYIVGALAIILINIKDIPNAFSMIFSTAFTGQAATGGFAGSTMMMALRNGVSRGVFEVFMDTIVICTMTALVVLVSGVWDSGLQGAALTSAAFDEGFRGGKYIVSIGLTLFAFSTILGWSYYGEKCAEYILGKKFITPYRLVYICLVFVGAIGGLQSIWAISDTLNGLMAIPNLIGLVLLSGVVVIMVKDFFKDPDRIRENEKEYLSVLPEKYQPRNVDK
ncbi:alanine/glycine:cation symporter family protein [Peptostreptococcus russellii]|uniref:alanine/glycine:cation symporter family protein n=1 Tax=Peptostreptococcus russellii TaxID=215200 RepID=UPI0029431E0C|nr:sodium:alanine symporter family protein [Peptostreptococcus russellii]